MGYGGYGKGDMDMGAAMQMVMQMMFNKKGSGKGYHQCRPEDHDMSGGILGEHVGTITSRATKYGFIESPVLKAQGYPDVFILGSELKDYKKDHTVKFTAYLDKNGKIKAKDLKSGLR